jgi:hypothetical protein
MPVFTGLFWQIKKPKLLRIGVHPGLPEGGIEPGFVTTGGTVGFAFSVLAVS